ncbi:MAG: cobalamin B12-binding domain-containing protein [Pseudomonadota bacterium]
MSLLELIARRSKVDPSHFSLPDLLAEQALARIAMQPRHHLNHLISECLAAELLREGSANALDYVQRLLDHGVSEERLLNGYVAGAADHLGHAWEKDDLSFAQVTHAMGQLLEVSRSVMRAPPADKYFDPDRPRVLLMRPPGEEHVLGLLLAAQEMRRNGWLVRVDLSADIAVLATTTGALEFDIIGLTAACPARLPDLQRAIGAARRAQPDARIALGGGLVTLDRKTAEASGSDVTIARGSGIVKTIQKEFGLGRGRAIDRVTGTAGNGVRT